MTGSGHSTRQRRQYGRILVADDDPILLELATSSLENGGYTVETAINGLKAIEKLTQHPFDLVITDLTMPELDGFGVIDHMRQHDKFLHVPIIVITTSDDYASIEHAFASGATSFVAKPINWSLFGHHIRYVMRASRRESELRTAHDTAEAASRLKSNLLSVMTHEFRTPLHLVLGFTELFVKEADGPLGAPEYKGYARHISDAANQLNSILTDMLLFSRALSKELMLQEDGYAVSQLLDEAITAVKPKALAQNVEIAVGGPIDAESSLYCDRPLIQRALGHLLDNAIKVSPSGARVTITALFMSNKSLIYTVKDEGCGMSADQIGNLLKPFVQADMSRNRSQEGMGLGLTLCHYIIEAHGGRLLIHSAPGEGATVGLVFPAQRVTNPNRQSERVAVA